PAQSRRACTWPFSSASAHLAPPAWLKFDTNELRRGSPPFHVAQDGRELVERPKRRWRAGGRIRISHADHGETVIWIAPLSPPRRAMGNITAPVDNTRRLPFAISVSPMAE